MSLPGVGSARAPASWDDGKIEADDVPVERPQGRLLGNALVAVRRLPIPRILVTAYSHPPAQVGSPDAARCGAAPLGGALKRAMDVAIAGLTLLLLAPIVPVLIVLIKLTSKGPIFYAHPRVGFGGRTFNCYKFRTMLVDGDRVLAQHLASDKKAAIAWSENQKLDADPRVTPIGHLLRKSSLDEIPQLINVLRGEMSCIGPRPIVAAELARYGVHGMDYIRSRPGLTGIWQVSGRSRRSYDDRVLLDHYYFRNWTVWLDLIILVKTVPCLLRFNETA
jgi:exopolysaccharide production protein ExoY